jgi:hydrogenase maturation protease
MYAVSLESGISPEGEDIVKDILVIGIGNILHKDDGVGVHLVNLFSEERPDLAARADFVDGGTAGFDLLPLMSGRSRIVIVDALRADDNPGSIYRIPSAFIGGSGSALSLHEAGVRKMLDMLYVMGEDPEIELLGIVAEDISSLEIGLSESLRNALPRAVEELIKIICE